ncbi:hypothetical protein GCM10020295_75300 [Streptomyces cinereospinus]
MSLNEQERARTSEELWANLRLAGTTPEDVRTELDFDEQQLRAALAVEPPVRPQDVWLLRDHLEDLVRERGGTPVPYTVLTQRARLAASIWFPLRRSPRRRRG